MLSEWTDMAVSHISAELSGVLDLPSAQQDASAPGLYMFASGACSNTPAGKQQVTGHSEGANSRDTSLWL